jgi:hypothetical protein
MLTKACAATGLVIAALGGALLLCSPANAGEFPPSTGSTNVNENDITNTNSSTNENTNTNTAAITDGALI